ncbi:MAG: phenylalanine--tRNA ligase subunit alpha [Saprospiraceae bacterium]|nr:phenylalanine--tRNA ligase subunit alpha [Saprospiraceae bacterium]MCF8252434.1 phenylalanine--tRNA ligase subunit alpha [Saprospiraceae bacterium]MCF8282281.1 phenylalanine--tRNA ligase subunit alpha [Bacteroidales bacterium]MCF8314040.1 phenylalanine--tRNA ligase subunit alpha [Saprospiraceae bacterium]MCF8442764.1 phenylalanine--tRNA ligase subunit alpha [Saprospiraceae bacterium]
MSDSFANVKRLIEEIAAANPTTKVELEQFRIQYLGSKNVIKPLMGEIRNVPNEQKKEYGQLVNEAKNAAEQKFAALQDALESVSGDADLPDSYRDFDLTRPGEPLELGSRHPIATTMNRIVGIFQRMGFAIAEGPDIEDDWHNFTAMNTPEDHPARDMQDTFYLQNSTEMLLRTHTSPVQARVMMGQKPPIRIIAPGRVYRNETISARSHAQFHQIEGLYVDENVSFADLKQTLMYFAQEMFGTPKIRLRPSFFPFTEPSAEMDVWIGMDNEKNYRLSKGTGWLEILGCGMVDPQVLENCGIDSSKYSGYAFGMGIERQAMRLYDIHDIRLFFENDVRFLKQFSAVI